MTQPNPVFDTTEPAEKPAQLPVEVHDANANPGRHAAEQAKVYKGVFDSTTITFDDGDTIEVPPNPAYRCLDDDCLAAYDALMFEVKSYDREPDIYIPEQVFNDKAGNEIKLAAETRPGPLITPHQKTGEDGVAVLVTPPHEVRVVQAALGRVQYEKLRKGLIKGRRGSAADVMRIWNEQGLALAERQRDDSKSDAGTSGLAAVPEADSQ